ncbi:MAG: DUF1571 domain-containing protein [Planctomycetia bacterium]|nr:DUF1571 domain-containing protein [Planctomycetia bacterium]
MEQKPSSAKKYYHLILESVILVGILGGLGVIFLYGFHVRDARAADRFGIVLPPGTVSHWVKTGQTSFDKILSPQEMFSVTLSVSDVSASDTSEKEFIFKENMVVTDENKQSTKIVKNAGKESKSEDTWRGRVSTRVENSETEGVENIKDGELLMLSSSGGNLSSSESGQKNVPQCVGVQNITEEPEHAPEDAFLSLVPGRNYSSLDMLLKWLKSKEKECRENLSDYTCMMTKRERIQGKLRQEEAAYVKIRHDPFSVYLRFVKPQNMEGREAIYVEGENGGNLIAHGAGWERVFGNFSLKPDSSQAMDGSLRPITEIGVLDIFRQILEICEFLEGSTVQLTLSDCLVNQRACLRVEILNPTAMPVKSRDKKSPAYTYYRKMHFYFDRVYGFPIRYSYWNTDGELLEERTYLEIRNNPGLKEIDFSTKNKEYQF